MTTAPAKKPTDPQLEPHNPVIFLRRLIDGEIEPPSSKERPDPEPARCAFCKCEDHKRPLFKAHQLMGPDWVTCRLCFQKFGRRKIGLASEFGELKV